MLQTQKVAGQLGSWFGLKLSAFILLFLSCPLRSFVQNFKTVNLNWDCLYLELRSGLRSTKKVDKKSQLSVLDNTVFFKQRRAEYFPRTVWILLIPVLTLYRQKLADWTEHRVLQNQTTAYSRRNNRRWIALLKNLNISVRFFQFQNILKKETWLLYNGW